MIKLREGLSHYWLNIQGSLFPWLKEELGPLTEKRQQFGWRKMGTEGLNSNQSGYSAFFCELVEANHRNRYTWSCGDPIGVT